MPVMTKETVKEDFADFLESFFQRQRSIEIGPGKTMDLLAIPDSPERSTLFVRFEDSLSQETLKQRSAVHLVVEALQQRERYQAFHQNLVHHDFREAKTSFMFSDLSPIVIHCLHHDKFIAEIVAKYVRMIFRFHKDELYALGRYRSITFDSEGKASTIKDEKAGMELVDVPVLLRVETSEHYVYHRDAPVVRIEVRGP
jgi:hypothetical protein